MGCKLGNIEDGTFDVVSSLPLVTRALLSIAVNMSTLNSARTYKFYYLDEIFKLGGTNTIYVCTSRLRAGHLRFSIQSFI